MSRTIVLATDGYVSVERQAFDLITSRIGSANFFSFGIGSAVNRYLIEALAHAGGAESFVATSPEEGRTTAEKFRAMIEAPLLTAIKVEATDATLLEPVPGRVPDLFAARPIMMIGKLSDLDAGTITISGSRSDGREERRFPLAEATRLNGSEHGLRYLWARLKIRELTDLAGVDSSLASRAQVTKLGLSYNLLTEWTSFVGIDAVRAAGTPVGTTVYQPLPLPQGVSPLAAINYRSPNYPSSLIRGGFGGFGELTTRYSDARMSNSVNAIVTYVQGTFGALVMVMSFLGALVFAIVAFRTRKRFAWVISLTFLALCLGSFVFRLFLASFFNDSSLPK
jgi:Ca-activated chloride channel family protein